MRRTWLLLPSRLFLLDLGDARAHRTTRCKKCAQGCLLQNRGSCHPLFSSSV